MQVLITGGCGFIGKKLAVKLLEKGSLTDSSGVSRPIDRLIVHDIIHPEPALPDDPRLTVRAGDFTDPAELDAILGPDTGVVFHLAAVVSGGAEADFDLGMRVNLTGSEQLLARLRALGTVPKVVFASSVAVYGGEMPSVIQDSTHLTPQTSYGNQKAATELLVNDYSRKGFIDGRSLRLPTIVIRPGKPNKAASSFASSILREPLQGTPYVCPVKPDTGVWVLSPRRVVEAFIHAAELPADAWGMSRAVALPGITVSVQDMVDALGQVTESAVVGRIRFEPDPGIERIVYGWATRFDPERGRRLGFQADNDMAEIIRAFIDDELGGDYAR